MLERGLNHRKEDSAPQLQHEKPTLGQDTVVIGRVNPIHFHQRQRIDSKDDRVLPFQSPAVCPRIRLLTTAGLVFTFQICPAVRNDFLFHFPVS